MDIDYANVFALTVYGKIGIKVWICKGEVLAKRDLNPNFVGGKSDVSDRRERRDGDHGHRDHRDHRDDRRGGGDRGGDRGVAVAAVVIAGAAAVAVRTAGRAAGIGGQVEQVAIGGPEEAGGGRR